MGHVVIGGRKVAVDPSAAIGKGGEADVFALRDGRALKLFKGPDHPDLAGQSAMQHIARARLAAVSDTRGAVWASQHLLATLIGVVVTPREAVVFRIGDGIVGINGRFTTIVAENDAPAYLGYRVLQAKCIEPATLEPVIEWHGPADDLESVVIATDGASALPGTGDDPHATLRDWLGEDALYAHPEALRRRLVRVARDEQLIDWDAKGVHRRPGLLKDDTSVIFLRRRASPEG